MTWVQITIVVLGSLARAGPRGLLSLKIAGIVLPIVLTAVTSLAAFFDFRSLAVAESRASLALRELQSQIEEAVVTGCVRTFESGDKLNFKQIDHKSIIEWQARLSAILHEDSNAYIKRREGSLTNK